MFCYFTRLEALDVQSYLNLECNQTMKTRDINNETLFFQEKNLKSKYKNNSINNSVYGVDVNVNNVNKKNKTLRLLYRNRRN